MTIAVDEVTPPEPRVLVHREAAYTPIPNLQTLGLRMNITSGDVLKEYSTHAHGIAATSGRTSNTRDYAYHRASGRKPPSRRTYNIASKTLSEHLQAGEGYYTDVSNPRHPDADGNAYARLAVDTATSYGVLSFSARKDTASLVAHLVQLEEESRAHTGRKPVIIRMDFASEAAVQGRGDDIMVQGIREYLSTRPGMRVMPLAPKS